MRGPITFLDSWCSPTLQRWRELTLKNDAVDVGIVYRRCRMGDGTERDRYGMYADGGRMSTKPYVSVATTSQR